MRVFVGVGSNVAPARNVRRALSALAALARIRGVSTFYRTPALGPGGSPPFYNGMVEVETELSPPALKRRLQGIEATLGRVRGEDKWAPRTIDLDLLLVAERDRVDAARFSPSDEVRRRAFVAAALAELAPRLVLPDGARVRDLARAAPPWPMDPLPAYTERLRRMLLAPPVP